MLLCLTRHSSSRSVTSPTQGGLFSMHQWPRDNFHGENRVLGQNRPRPFSQCLLQHLAFQCPENIVIGGMTWTLGAGYAQLSQLPARTLATPARDSGQPLASRKQSRNRQGKNPLKRKTPARRVAWVWDAPQSVPQRNAGCFRDLRHMNPPE
jgi:hypothetical protein